MESVFSWAKFHAFLAGRMETGDENATARLSVLGLREYNNALWCENNIWTEEACLIRLTQIQRCRTFSERVGPRIL